MKTMPLEKQTRHQLILGIIIGILLVVLGITLGAVNEELAAYRKGIIALSLLPFAIAITSALRLVRLRTRPETMKAIIIDSNDERLRQLRNEADATAFHIVESALFLGYMAYTLLFPEDVFETFAWWLMLALLFIAFASQGYLQWKAQHNSSEEDNE